MIFAMLYATLTAPPASFRCRDAWLVRCRVYYDMPISLMPLRFAMAPLLHAADYFHAIFDAMPALC